MTGGFHPCRRSLAYVSEGSGPAGVQLGTGPRAGAAVGTAPSAGREEGVEDVLPSHQEVQVDIGEPAEAVMEDGREDDVVQGGVIGRILPALWVADRLSDQVDRRRLRGGTIPHEEKIFSIFEPHPRWIAKGKAGRPVELGVPVCVLEDPYGLLLPHRVRWQGGDVDVAVPMIQAARAQYPDRTRCRFDRRFHPGEPATTG